MAEPIKVGDVVWVTAKSRPEQAQGVVVSSDEEGGWALVEHDGVEKGPFGWGWGELILRDKVQHPVAWSQTVLDKIEETGGQGWTVLFRVRYLMPMTSSIYLSCPGVQEDVWWTLEGEEMPSVASGSGSHPPLIPDQEDPHQIFRGREVLDTPDPNPYYASAYREAINLLRSLNGGPAITMEKINA
jgi:hypothetical protein